MHVDINDLSSIGLLRMPIVLVRHNPRHVAFGYGVEGY